MNEILVEQFKQKSFRVGSSLSEMIEVASDALGITQNEFFIQALKNEVKAQAKTIKEDREAHQTLLS